MIYLWLFMRGSSIITVDVLPLQVRTVTDRETLERVAPTAECLIDEYTVQSVTPSIAAAVGALFVP